MATCSAVRSDAVFSVERLRVRFLPYQRIVREGDGSLVGLALRACVVHPLHTNLAFLSDADRDTVWKAVAADAIELSHKTASDAVRAAMLWHSHMYTGACI
jgi:hypothetical protein